MLEANPRIIIQGRCVDEAALFGKRVKATRERLGLGLSDAARRAKIPPQKLQDAENGADSRATTVAAICRGLGVSADFLLGLDSVSLRVEENDEIKRPAILVDRLAALEEQVADLETAALRAANVDEALGALLRLLESAEELPGTLRDRVRAQLEAA